jgi:hypothetical protein
MLPQGQVNPAPVCVLLGGRKAIESAQEVFVLLRSPSTPHQTPTSLQRINLKT